MKLDDYVTVKEAAAILGITTQQVLLRIKRKQLQATKLGWSWLIKRSQLRG